jgi:CheY-like chemotaxis protein/two-component sensor histidine kinase
MNAIIGFSEFIMNEMEPEKRRKYMDIIRNSSNMLLQIIDDILDLSRIESGMGEFQIGKTDISELVNEVANIYRPNMKPKVALCVEIPETCLEALTDANRVKQILFNLLSNAVKYTDKGYITLKVEENEENLCFSVIDTGCGIPEDKLNLIFDRFEKLDRFIPGTGLGLTISKSIVERLGGKIAVTSTEGEGSTFSFTIPYRSVLHKKKKIGSVRELAASQRKRILVAEDSEQDFQYIKNILEKKYDVVGVFNGEKTVSSFILDKPNLVLICMPILTTGDAIHKIRSISTTIPIIAMTTSDFYHDQRWAIENGCTDVISKPFSATKLEEVVMAFA